jgi:hypothetical protein
VAKNSHLRLKIGFAWLGKKGEYLDELAYPHPGQGGLGSLSVWL